jgi:hypothetical protein
MSKAKKTPVKSPPARVESVAEAIPAMIDATMGIMPAPKAVPVAVVPPASPTTSDPG